MQAHKPIIHLRVVVGKPSYNQDGSLQNQNMIVKLEHDTSEFTNYLKQIPFLGFGKVEVEKVTVFENGSHVSKPELIEVIKKEIQETTQPKAANLTEDQKRIAQLEAQIKAILDMQRKSNDSNDVDELELARIEYTDLTGEKGDKRWTIETINQKIAEFKAK